MTATGYVSGDSMTGELTLPDSSPDTEGVCRG